MKRVLLSSFPCIIRTKSTGYSKQIHYLIKIFKEFGYKIFYLSYANLIDNNSNYTRVYSYAEVCNSYINYNTNYMNDEYLYDVEYLYMRTTNAVSDKINDIINRYDIQLYFNLGDARFFSYSNCKFNVPSYHWNPAHFYPITPDEHSSMKLFENIISLTPSLKIVFDKEFPDKNVFYLPHITEKMNIQLSKSEIRTKWGLSNNKFIMSIVTNLVDRKYMFLNRKAMDAQLIAFKQFNDKYNCGFLYIHTNTYTEPDGYYPLTSLLKCLNLPSESFYWNIGTKTETEIHELYKLSDVFLNCSKAEGFGVPIVEAQNYNVNVITTDYLAMAEYNFQQNLVNVSTEHWDYGLGGKFAMPSSESIFNILEKTYLECELNRTKIQRAQWIVNQLTSYDVVKNELYNIINKPKSGISQLPSNHHI